MALLLQDVKSIDGAAGVDFMCQENQHFGSLLVMWAPEGAPQELDEGRASAFGAQQCSASCARSAV